MYDSELGAFADGMIETMHRALGIGLAAQQVGRPVQVCVVDLRSVESEFDWKLDGARTPLDLFMPMVIVNPKLTVARKTPTEVLEEGCLSFPEVRGDVERAVSVTAKYHDQHGLPHILECTGLFARCILHEADHLNGILFIDRMTKAVRSEIDEAVKALAKRTKAGKTAAP